MSRVRPHSRRPAAGIVDPPRRAAADALLAVDRDAAYLNLVLPPLLRARGITGRDAAFATEIAYGAARRAGVLLPVVGYAARREPESLDPAVRVVLLLGAYQLLHTRVPPHAAVDSSVELVRELAGPRPTGLVNAVLRRVGRHRWDEWVERLAPPDPLGRLAFRTGHPRWVAEAFQAALGDDRHELPALLAADDQPAAVHLAARRIPRDELLAQAGPDARPGRYSPYAVHLAAGDPGRIPAVRDGAAGVTDEGSQLVALALAAAPLTGADRGRWLDLCAGPGGKAALLEALLPPSGRLVTVDRAPRRAELVRAVLSRPATVIADGTAPPFPDGGFDRVLVDAPCTGLGALRRRPEARWRRQPADVPRLAELQRRLLVVALRLTRPGGVVAYATCSPHPAETREVVAAALAVVPARRLDVWAALPVLDRRGNVPEVQLWPHRHGTDAMYLALLAVP